MHSPRNVHTSQTRDKGQSHLPADSPCAKPSSTLTCTDAGSTSFESCKVTQQRIISLASTEFVHSVRLCRANCCMTTVALLVCRGKHSQMLMCSHDCSTRESCSTAAIQSASNAQMSDSRSSLTGFECREVLDCEMQMPCCGDLSIVLWRNKMILLSFCQTLQLSAWQWHPQAKFQRNCQDIPEAADGWCQLHSAAARGSMTKGAARGCWRPPSLSQPLLCCPSLDQHPCAWCTCAVICDAAF